MKILARAKLGDVFRKVHGNKATCYTREGQTVRTRLDRIYATEYSSEIVWHSHEIDAKYAKNVDTDHEPVVAKMALLGEERKNKSTTKINKELYQDKEMYRKMKELMETLNKKYARIGDLQAGNKWEEFKARAHGLLVEETRNRELKMKEERALNTNITKLECHLRYIQKSKSRPMDERTKIIKIIKENLREEAQNFQPAGPKTAYRRF